MAKGQISAKFVDLAGKRFTRLLVLEKCAEKTKSNRTIWLVRCDCGVIKRLNTADLTSKHSQSCGCLQRDRVSETVTLRNRTHGLSYTRELSSYWHMMYRCYDASTPHFERYGGRGIQVCAGWRNNPTAFFADMKTRPTPQHTLDRKDNEGHYSCGHCPECLTQGWPANCQWSTRKEQLNNTSINVWFEYQGETRTIAQWAEHFHVSLYRAKKKLISSPDAHIVTKS